MMLNFNKRSRNMQGLADGGRDGGRDVMGAVMGAVPA